MAYTALYRKFRPQVFEDVKGQDAVVTTLKNQIKANRIGHAYLFCGTRGTGKTTIAKIFAKAVNCENPVDGSPCGCCASCQAVAAGSSMNVVEMDAASNNGVDHVRELKEEVAYSPTQGKYRVYIIDEVHMMSNSAFNALLKTLEEPPAYVIFILATTEPHKLPITILSRCQRYDFRRITTEVIADRLRELVTAEQVEIEEKALTFIARAGDGSLRDAISLLDRCIAFYLGENLTYEKVLSVLGAVDQQVFGELLQKILLHDVAGIMVQLDEMMVRGRECAQLVTDFTWYLRNLLLVKTSDQTEEMLELSAENFAVLKESASRIQIEEIMRWIRILSELSNQLRNATQKRVLTELAFIRLCKPQMETDTQSLLARMKELEERMETTAFSMAQGNFGNGFPLMPQMMPETKAVPIKPPVPKAVPEDIKQVVSNWKSIIRHGSIGPMQQGYLRRAKLNLGAGNTLLLAFTDPTAADFVNRPGNKELLSQIIAEVMGKEVEIQVQSMEESAMGVDLRDLLKEEIQFDIEIEEFDTEY